MGFIINDTVEVGDFGQSLSGLYATLSSKIDTRKVGNDYRVRGMLKIYFNKQAYLDGKRYLAASTKEVTAVAADLDNNLFTKLYTDIKTEYTSTTDDL